MPGKRALHIEQLVHVCVGETKGWNYIRTEHSDSKCCADLPGVPNWFNWLKWLNWLNWLKHREGSMLVIASKHI